MFQYIIIVCAAYIMWWLWQDTIRPKGSPPGPPYWPFFGNLLQMMWLTRSGKPTHLILEDMINQYGDVVQLRLAQDKMVIVSGKEMTKEVSFREEFNARPDSFVFKFRSQEMLGVVLTEGETWIEQRRFVLKTLRDLGFGKRSMETTVLEETTALEEFIKKNMSKPFQVDTMFSIPVINILWAIVAGQRFPIGDKKLQKLFEIINRFFKTLHTGGSILNQFPWLRHIIPENSGFTAMETSNNEISRFINETIDEHKNTLNIDEPRDLIDLYFVEMRKLEGQNTSFTRDQLLFVCMDFFQAGSETTSNSLAFFFLYMVLYPEVQKKIQKEIDTVIGNERQVTFQDRISMPYTEATIMETMRMSPVTPLLVAHRAKNTTQLKNYTIEKGSTVLISAYNMHMDSYWKDPDVFRPERFIGENGKVIQDENLIPFGMGKRRCVGETLARSSVFLFPVSLLRKFDVTAAESEPRPVLENADGITQSPKPFKAVFRLRKENIFKK